MRYPLCIRPSHTTLILRSARIHRQEECFIKDQACVHTPRCQPTYAIPVLIKLKPKCILWNVRTPNEVDWEARALVWVMDVDVKDSGDEDLEVSVSDKQKVVVSDRSGVAQ